MKNAFFLCPIGVLIISVLISACAEEPILYDISEADLNLDTLTIYSISDTSYQSPPEIGEITNLYFGNQNGFHNLFSMVELYSQATGSTPFFFQDLLDSTITLDSVDSAIFTLIYSKDTIVTTPSFVLYYFPNGVDSIFNETASNYLNLSESDLSDAQVAGITQLNPVEPDSNEVTYPELNFILPPEVIEALTDSNSNRTFMLKTEEDWNEFLPFNSSESGKGPKLTVYFRQTTDDSDFVQIDTFRTFLAQQDLTILEPPDLTEIDTTFISLGRAKGLKSIIYFDLDTLSSIDQPLIKSAELHLFSEAENEINQFTVIGYPLIDSINVEDQDPYQINSDPLFKMDATITNNKLKLQVRPFIQYVDFGILENQGVKLFTDVANDDPFQVIHFNTVSQDSLQPYLFIQYVAD